MQRFRLIPVVIFFAGLTLTVKLGALWQDMDIAIFAPAVAEPKATSEAAAEAKAKLGAKDGDKSEGSKMAKAASGDAKPGEAANSKMKNDEAEDGADGNGFDPAMATDAEVDVLQKLANRRDELNKRSRNIDLRENMLVATERRVKEKIAELKKYQTIIEGLLRKHDGQKEKKYRSLVKIYESMKPKDAARIFEQLEMEVLLSVVERMREARTGPILAKMAPRKAKALTSALAARNDLPALVKK
jgi:flagellar motility protein MotE (MotC chaperone)